MDTRGFIKKFKVPIIIALVVVAPIIFIIASSKNYKNEDNEDYEKVSEYLNENNKVINIADTNDFSGLDILKDDLKDKKIIFTGEDHTLDKDNLMKIKMIKYLQKEIGLNYCLDEIGYSDAYFINKYLETGYESILKKSFDHSKGTAMYNIDDYNTYKEIYKLNQTLPKDKRIKVVGVDIEHGGESSYDCINELIKNENIKLEKVETLLSELKKYHNREIDPNNLKETIKIVKEDITNNEKAYTDMLDDNIEDFKYIINNLNSMCISYSSKDKDWNNVRDRFIYENFKKIDSKLQDAKYFGQWGSFHIYKDTIDKEHYDVDTEFIASHLNKDEKYKDKILSIQYGYYGTGANKTNYYTITDEKIFKDYINTTSDAIIFKLKGTNSPFTQSNIYPFEYNILTNTEKVTTDYIDYTIMIKEAQKSKPL